jgi:bacteriorhodopsin
MGSRHGLVVADFQGVAQSYNSMMEQNQRMHEKLTVLTNIMMTSSEVKKGQQSLENRLDDLLNRVVLVSENGKAECQQMFVKDATASTGGADASSDRSADLNLKEPRERQRSSDSLYFSEVSRSSKLGDLLEVRRQEVIEDRSKHSLSHSVAICCERITCAAFTMACLVMLSLWARHVNHGAFVGTFFITAIAAMTYYAKSCHMGDWVILGQAVPVARYLDWFTTTPLMLYELCHIAHAPASDTIMLIMCDLAMIATGIIAALIPWKPHAKHKMVWFILSCMFYVLMLVTIYVDVSAYAKKQTEEAENLFKQLEVLMISVWSFYPIVVLLGRAQLGIITKPVEDVMLCILDATAKIGMEGFIVATCFSGCLATEGGDGH